MRKFFKSFISLCIIFSCIVIVVPINAVDVQQETTASTIRPYTFGFGTSMDNDEGVSKLIEEGKLEHLTFTDSTGYSIKYWVHIPRDDKGAPIKNLPLVMYMHGYSDGGDNNIAIRYHNAVVFRLIQQQNDPKRQAVLLIPQTPNAQNGAGESDYFKDQWVGIKGNDKWSQWNIQEWDMDKISRTRNLNAVVDLVKAVQKQTNADVDRAYVTGISMGGYATWDLISRNNENIFAAAVPICSVGDPNKIENAKNVPIKLYHGTLDSTINPASSRKMYSLLRKYGNISYIEYKKENHASWNAAYSPIMDDNKNDISNLDDLIAWMFNQSRNGTLDGKVNKDPLVSAIWDAKQEVERDYSPAKWVRLQNNIKKAESLVNIECDEIEVKDIIAELDKIILDENKDKADMTELLEKIKEGNELREIDYTVDSWLRFKQSLTNAKDIANNINASQDEVDSALTALQNAIDNLEYKVVDTNKTALSIAIKMAEAVTQEQLDKVVPAVVNEFKSALENARNVNAKENASQEEVDNAFDRLAKVMHMLEFYKGDKAALQKMMDQIASLKTSDYTDATWNALQAVLPNVNKVIENVNAMQKEVDEVYTELVKAFINLRLKPNKDLLNDLISKANGINRASYTAASLSIVDAEVAKANAVLNDPNATEKAVNNAVKGLTRALSGLEKVNPETPVDNSSAVTPIKPGDTTVTAVKTGDDSNIIYSLMGLVIIPIMLYKKSNTSYKNRNRI